jgi:tetratricopeptide (TPR) repeat protein
MIGEGSGMDLFLSYCSAPIVTMASAADAQRELDHGRPASAERIATAIVVDEPRDAEAWGVLALALQQQGKIERAATEAAKAVEANPSNASAHGYRALGLSELGDDAEAVKEAERAVQLAPTDSAAHLNLAIAAKRTDTERAIAEARRAIDLGRENFSAYQLLMKCLLESGRYQEAAAFGPEWLAVSPFDAAAHSSVAVAMRVVILEVPMSIPDSTLSRAIV